MKDKKTYGVQYVVPYIVGALFVLSSTVARANSLASDGLAAPTEVPRFQLQEPKLDDLPELAAGVDLGLRAVEEGAEAGLALEIDAGSAAGNLNVMLLAATACALLLASAPALNAWVVHRIGDSRGYRHDLGSAVGWSYLTNFGLLPLIAVTVLLLPGIGSVSGNALFGEVMGAYAGWSVVGSVFVGVTHHMSREGIDDRIPPSPLSPAPIPTSTPSGLTFRF